MTSQSLMDISEKVTSVLFKENINSAYPGLLLGFSITHKDVDKARSPCPVIVAFAFPAFLS